MPSPSMRNAALMQFMSKYASMGCQLLITAVLARLISPEDFGLLAMVTVFTALFTMFSDMGIGVAIVQFQDLEERDFGALFFFSALLALGLAGLFCAVSPLLAGFYGEPGLVPLCLTSSLVLVFSTLNMVPNGLMLRERRFGAIGLRLIAATVISGVAAIVTALMGAGVYALIVQSVLSAVIVFFWNVAIRPIGGVNIHFVDPLRRIFSYSAFQLGFNLINYFSRNLDKLLIGKWFGAVDVGNYDKAYKLTGYPMSAFSTVVASVVQPFMAKHQDEPDVVFDYWLRIERALSLIGAAVVAVFVSAAPEIIELFYGSQWNAAIPAFAALSFSVYFQIVWNPSGAFFQSLGHTDLMFKAGLINTVITVGGLFVGLASGCIGGVAICVSATYCLHSVFLCRYLLKGCFGKGAGVLLEFVPEVCLALLATLACFLLSPLLPPSVLSSLVCKLLICGIIIAGGYWLTGQMEYLKLLLRK